VSASWARAVLAVVVLAVLTHARVTVARGCTVPLPVLALAAGAVVLAALIALAAWTVRDFRSPPPWHPAYPPGGAR
jgi:hypothetical protein